MAEKGINHPLLYDIVITPIPQGKKKDPHAHPKSNQEALMLLGSRLKQWHKKNQNRWREKKRAREQHKGSERVRDEQEGGQAP